MQRVDWSFAVCRVLPALVTVVRIGCALVSGLLFKVSSHLEPPVTFKCVAFAVLSHCSVLVHQSKR